MTHLNLVLTDEPWGGELGETLRGELEAELLERYGRDGEPGDQPTVEDVEVFLVARDADGEPLGCGALCARAPGSGELKRSAYAGALHSRCFEKRLAADAA